MYKDINKSKIRSDSKWNFIGFLINGISAILINILIALLYDTKSLGVFNLHYAIYILLSQFAAAGIHLSILKYIAQYSGKPEEPGILLSGLVAVSANSIAFLCIIYLLSDVFRIFFDSAASFSGFYFLLPAIFFFSLNKVALAFLNGKKAMRKFAVLYSLRPVLMLTALGILFLWGIDSNFLCILFLLAEATLFLLLLPFFAREIASRNISMYWTKRHFLHGYKAAIGNILIDVNTRVDVLMLGYLTNEKLVGIYSLAGMIADGFNQLPIVFRTVINPYITGLYYSSDRSALQKKMIEGRNMSYRYLLLAGLLVMGGYPVALWILGIFDVYAASVIPLLLLMAGILSGIGYAPFQMIFNQTGHPAVQSLYYFIIFTSNVILNAILIPVLGISGAALATGISFVISWLILRILIWRIIQVSI